MYLRDTEYDPKGKQVSEFARVPENVKEACWKAASRELKVPLNPKRHNPAQQKAYEARMRAWMERKEKLAEEKQAAELAASAIDQATSSNNPESVEGEKTVVEVQPVQEEVPDSWDDEEVMVELAAASKPENFVKGIEYDRQEAKLKIALPHGHAVLAGTRLWADVRLRTQALGLALQKVRPGVRVAVVDVGSGASGVRQALRLRDTTKEAATVYHHCIMPVACDADLVRVRSLGDVLGRLNWVSEENPPRLSMVNVCMHTAASCNCLSWYDVRVPFTVHAHYYFTMADWHNLLRYADVVRTFGHYPLCSGQRVPELKSEAIWRPAVSSVLVGGPARLHARLRARLLGHDEMVAFEPLKTHGTTYCHVNPTLAVSAGGFHMPGWAGRTLESQLVSVNRCLAIAALDTLGRSMLLAAVVPNILVGNFKRALVWGGLASLAVLPAIGLKWVHQSKSWQRPPPGTQYTVTVANVAAMVVDGEEIGHFFDYMRNPACGLEPRGMASFRPDDKLALEIASTMMLSKKPEAEKLCVAAARCFRDGLSPAAAADTMRAAQEHAVAVMPKNEVCEPSTWKPPLASGAQLCALVTAAAVARVVAAGSWSCMQERGLRLARSVDGCAIVKLLSQITTAKSALPEALGSCTSGVVAGVLTSSGGPLLTGRR